MTERRSQIAATQSHVTPAPILRRKCACGAHTSGQDQCDGCKKKRPLQTKLQIGASNDIYEREADRVADHVMSSSSPVAAAASVTRLSRTAADSHDVGGQVPASVDQALAAPGHGLGAPLRAEMEGRFGQDFSGVRVHTDALAGQSARDVNAHAYTVGQDIVFAPGTFAPQSMQGKRLIAHELTHVLQQAPSSTAVQRSEVLQRESKDDGSGKQKVSVSISVLGDCPDARKIAEAIPMASSMLATAENWLIDYPFLQPHQQKFVDALLRAHFGSSADEVRLAIHSRIIRMHRIVEAAANAGVTFDCRPDTQRKCSAHPWAAYVTRGEGNVIHICPDFYAAGIESRQLLMMHEAAHIAGAVGTETYIVNAGPIGLAECLRPTGLSKDQALGNAESYAWFVFCLSRPPGVTIIPGVTINATPTKATGGGK